MNVRNLMLNGLFIAVIASCAALAACGSSKKDICEACSNNGDCNSGQCASFTVKSTGDRFLACADASTTTCNQPQ